MCKTIENLPCRAKTLVKLGKNYDERVNTLMLQLLSCKRTRDCEREYTCVTTITLKIKHIFKGAETAHSLSNIILNVII